MAPRPGTCRVCGRPLAPGGPPGRRGVCVSCAATRKGTPPPGAQVDRSTGLRLEGDAAREAMAPPTVLPGPGTDLGGLVIERRLGEGGMGQVLVARDPGLDRRVAVKFLRGALIGNSRAERFFRREGKALAGIHHENVVRVFSVGVWKEWPYLVMELVEGAPLSDRLREGPLTVPEALRIAEEIASALAAVHAAKMAHRDVTPSNIMLRTRDGSACLVDFGLAKAMDRVTATTGGPVGTPLYMAPEQVARTPCDHRVDIYSFGATLFEALTGKAPHEGNDSAGFFRAVLHEDAPLLRSVRGDAPPALEALLARALARAPELRQPDGSVLLEEVRSARRFPDGTAPPPPPAPVLPSRDPSESLPLVGRNAEYETVVGALEGIARQRGRLVLVEGEAGSGKSRILRELERAARARGLGVIHCAGSEYSGSPYRALREGFLGHARALGASSPEKAVGLMARASPSNRPLAPALRWFLDPEHGEGGARPGRSDLVRAVLSLLRAFLKERPLLLVAEDAHLLDEGSLDLLVAAAEEGASWPLALALSFRPLDAMASRAPLASRIPRLRGIPGAAEVLLGPLSEGAVATMIHHSLRVNEAEACLLAPILHRKSSGNPLFLIETLRLLEQERAVGVHEGQRRIRERLSSLAIPPRLLELASRRIAGLPAAERDALGVASVDPLGVDSDLVAWCLDCSKMRALRALQHLVKTRGILRQDGERYRILHAEVREAVYAELIPELRTAYHAEAARVLEEAGGAEREPSRLGRHLAKAGAAERAVPHLLEAGRRLLAGHAPADALDHFEEALRCAGARGCPAAAAGRAQVLELLGDLDAARTVLEGMVRAGGAAAEEAILPLAEFERNRGRHREVLELLERAAPLDLGADRRLRLHLLEAQAESRLANGDAALAAMERAEALSKGASKVRLLELWNTQGMVRWRLNRFGEAMEWFERALPLAEEIGSVERTSILLHNLGLACSELGRSGEALVWAEKAAERAQLIGNRRTQVYARLLRAELLLDSLKVRDADQELEGIEAEVTNLDDLDSLHWFLGCRAEVRFWTGDFPGALDWVNRAMAHAAQRPQKAAELRLIRARAQLELSMPEEALAEARLAHEYLRSGSEAKRTDEALAYAARALRELGREGEERDWLRSLTGTLSPQAAVERALEEGAPRDREAWLKRARDLAVEERSRRYLLRAGN